MYFLVSKPLRLRWYSLKSRRLIKSIPLFPLMTDSFCRVMNKSSKSVWKWRAELWKAVRISCKLGAAGLFWRRAIRPDWTFSNRKIPKERTDIFDRIVWSTRNAVSPSNWSRNHDEQQSGHPNRSSSVLSMSSTSAFTGHFGQDALKSVPFPANGFKTHRTAWRTKLIISYWRSSILRKSWRNSRFTAFETETLGIVEILEALDRTVSSLFRPQIQRDNLEYFACFVGPGHNPLEADTII